MFNVIANRIVWTCLMMAAISVMAFTLIQLPPGDFVDSYVSGRQQSGTRQTVDMTDVEVTSAQAAECRQTKEFS